jgi:hypothetical protein
MGFLAEFRDATRELFVGLAEAVSEVAREPRVWAAGAVLILAIVFAVLMSGAIA